LTEKELIQQCILEDRGSQEELFRRYAGKMLAVCIRYTRHRMEAEDVLQDAFIKVFDNLEKYEFKGSFEGWIRRIVVNTALKKQTRKSYKNELYGVDYVPEGSQHPRAIASLNADYLLELIQELPMGYKTVFNLYAIEGYSHKEIAEALGIGESTSRSQLAKARAILQTRIAPLYDEKMVKR